MNAAITSINDLSHEEICAWLKRALQGLENLPLVTLDEAPYLGVLRLEKTLKPAARDSLRDACHQLVRQFVTDGLGQQNYLQELLFLATDLQNVETQRLLASLARQFPAKPQGRLSSYLYARRGSYPVTPCAGHSLADSLEHRL